MIKQFSKSDIIHVWIGKTKTMFLMYGGNQSHKGTTPMLKPFCSQQSLNIKKAFHNNVSSRSINQWPFPRLVMNSHIYLTYIKQGWRQNKFYGSSSLNLICSRNAERKPLNIAIKLLAPSGDCYNDVTIETDPGVFLTLGGATICRGSELQPSVQDGIPNDHIHYSVWDYYICIHFFPFSRPFFPISHSNNMHKQILVYSAFIYFKVSLNL